MTNYKVVIAGIVTAMGLAQAAGAAVLSTVAVFDSATTGGQPNGALVVDAAGNFYGTTSTGGAGGYGTIYKYSASQGLTTLTSFDGAALGGTSRAGLTIDAEGNLYGSTTVGGNGYGTVFKYSSTGGLTTLHAFSDTDGRTPSAAPVFGPDGSLYGTTFQGGTLGSGTVYKISSVSGTPSLSVVVNLGASNNYSNAPVVFDAAGNLLTTSSTGGSVYGSVYQVTPDGSSTTLINFSRYTANTPSGGLVSDGAGNFYGVNSGGYNLFIPGLGTLVNYGSIFKVSANGEVTSLYDFGGAGGRNPSGALLVDAEGKLFGTTRYGGDFGFGMVFSYDPTTGLLTTLASFDSTTGSQPVGQLTADAFGNLYGTTYAGGSGVGTIFKVTGSGFVGASVPEPVSMALPAMACLGLTARRRRALSSK